MTIQEAGREIRTALSRIYEEGESAAISEWVMEHVTGLSRSERATRQQHSISGEQQQLIQTFLPRLLRHEPVQYVLNETWFCGLKLYIDNNVLIPRPETEELVEWVIANCKFPLDHLSILDIGCGSGCISIALKRKLRKAEVWGCDLSAQALGVAEKNATGLNARVNYVQLDFLDSSSWYKLPAFDIIISNPPYIPERDRSGMQPNVLDHEPHIALFVPDNNATVFYEAIARFAEQHLNPGGTIYTEIHEQLATDVTGIFSRFGFSTELKKDMQGKDRMTRSIRK